MTRNQNKIIFHNIYIKNNSNQLTWYYYGPICFRFEKKCIFLCNSKNEFFKKFTQK